MRIAICDDEKSEQQLLQRYIGEWAEREKIPLQTVTFDTGESFAFVWEEDKAFDLIVLDIEMGKLNGMELARQIRREDTTVPLLFVTGYEEFMASGYEVSALQYLLKPLYKEKLFETLDRLRRQNLPGKRVILPTAEGMTGISLHSVCYAEALGHQCMVHTLERDYEIRENFGEVAECLGTERFVKCHRSYLVNLQYISIVRKNEIVLDNGAVIPLSRSSVKEVNEAFIRFHRNI